MLRSLSPLFFCLSATSPSFAQDVSLSAWKLYHRGDEFTKLIVTQQAYSANTRVVTTSNQMVQDVLNMLR